MENSHHITQVSKLEEKYKALWKHKTKHKGDDHVCARVYVCDFTPNGFLSLFSLQSKSHNAQFSLAAGSTPAWHDYHLPTL